MGLVREKAVAVTCCKLVTPEFRMTGHKTIRASYFEAAFGDFGEENSHGCNHLDSLCGAHGTDPHVNSQTRGDVRAFLFQIVSKSGTERC